MIKPVIAEHIEMTPGVCGGKPRIAGHRIRVEDIVILHDRMGMSHDEILLHYPTITLSDVYAALAYYHDNLETIRQQRREDEAFAREKQTQTPSKVQQKLNQIGMPRVLGLHANSTQMSDDFDEPLPDEFWLGNQ